MLKKTLSFAVMCTLAAPVIADDITQGKLIISDPVAGTTAASAQAGAGYFSVTNIGEEDDVLLSVSADFPRVMIHESVMDGDVMTMSMVDTLPVLAGETVTFEPGGLHIMFMGLNGDPFEEGETIEATLMFERAGPVAVEFMVTDLEKAATHSH